MALQVRPWPAWQRVRVVMAQSPSNTPTQPSVNPLSFPLAYSLIPSDILFPSKDRRRTGDSYEILRASPPNQKAPDSILTMSELTVEVVT
ncbi:hypothetical protein EVAR_29061_1 [Eumeta japonica]|uniref:Uncharacterized protein n=1 Tax=Eumeta variegata TaxID=151549 RepID=A0A4C1VMG5_EUMVA|nr:hypothetical protein EVAR_29061_1 [Eumeta japonica]